MNILNLCAALLLVLAAVSGEEEKKKKLQIGIKKRIDPENCPTKSRKGDKLHMKYRGTLDDGTEFDKSGDNPFVMVLGMGQVIKGWDQGLLGMCQGEKRKLVIPSHLAYGDAGAGAKIPGGATLIFEVELVKIERKEEL